MLIWSFNIHGGNRADFVHEVFADVRLHSNTQASSAQADTIDNTCCVIVIAHHPTHKQTSSPALDKNAVFLRGTFCARQKQPQKVDYKTTFPWRVMIYQAPGKW